MKLSPAEEDLMHLLWDQGSCLLKDLVNAHREPKPAQTTVATLLKRMQEKGFVTYTARGRAREYYPTVSKKDYFFGHLNKLIANFFNNSKAQFASYFTRETNLSKEQLEELKRLIEEEIEKK